MATESVTGKPAPDKVDDAAGERLSEAADRTFTPRSVRWIVGIGVVSLLATLLLSVLTTGAEPREESSDSNAFSYSAVGHRSFVALLERLDIDVTVSRHRSVDKASPTRPLFVLEPNMSEKDLEHVTQMVSRAIANDIPVVFALPKWRVITSPIASKSWAEGIELVSTYSVQDAIVAVTRAVASDHDYIGAITLERFERDAPVARVRGSEVQYALDLRPMQVISAQDELEPIITIDGDDDRMLLARIRDSKVYFLSDPDILNTMGIGIASHAPLAVAIVDTVLGAEEIVIDEVNHGFEKTQTIWEELFSFPLVLVTLHLAGLLALALWAALVRFGKPEALPPRVPAGKQTLLDNTATLLALGRHAGYGAKRYFETTLRALSRTHGIAAEVSEDARLAQLAAIAQRRGGKTDLIALSREVADLADRGGARDQHRARDVARRIFAFRMELTHGHRIDS